MGIWVRNQTKKGWLTAILELGAWVGTLYSGFLAEIISRKYAILVNTAVFIIGVIVQTTAVTGTGASSILGGRFVTGMGVGSLSMIVPMVCGSINPVLIVTDVISSIMQRWLLPKFEVRSWDCSSSLSPPAS